MLKKVCLQKKWMKGKLKKIYFLIRVRTRIFFAIVFRFLEKVENRSKS